MALVASATPARAQYAQYDQIITPNQFIFTGWDGNLQWSTVGAYPGDGPNGYAWTANYSATPSATVLIPLPDGLWAGAHLYRIYELIPSEHSLQWHIVDIAADGTMLYNPNHDPNTGIPWEGQFGTDHQYLQDPQSDQGAWLELGPGPQSDPDLDSGYWVWINPSTGHGAPYLQIHYVGFENSEESFDAFRVVEIDIIPEPSTIALGLLGGFALFVCRPRTPFTHQVTL